MNPFEISAILTREITEEQRKAALISTAQLLRKIDIHGIEKMRVHFELPPEALGILTELYCMMLVSPRGMKRVPMPISSTADVIDGKHVSLIEVVDGVRRPSVKLFPGKMRTVRAKPLGTILPQRLIISNAGEGAKALIINDLRIDGKSQFAQAGDIPAEMFRHDCLDSFTSLKECSELLEIDVTYIGTNQDGVDMYGALVGITDGIPSELLIEEDSDAVENPKAP